MPPISPMKDGATGKTVKSATLTPLRTLELNEVTNSSQPTNG